jgi:hypothetical protein
MPVIEVLDFNDMPAAGVAGCRIKVCRACRNPVAKKPRRGAGCDRRDIPDIPFQAYALCARTHRFTDNLAKKYVAPVKYVESRGAPSVLEVHGLSLVCREVCRASGDDRVARRGTNQVRALRLGHRGGGVSP